MEYYYAVTAVDNLGNEDKSVVSVSGIVDDAIAPVISITSPTDTVYRKSTINIEYSPARATITYFRP